MQAECGPPVATNPGVAVTNGVLVTLGCGRYLRLQEMGRLGVEIDAVDAFVIDVEAFAIDEGVPPPASEPRSLGRLSLQSVTQVQVGRVRPPPIAPRRRAQPDKPTRASPTGA